MEQNGDGDEEDDYYPDRRFSFAPDISKPKQQPVQNDDMQDLKTKLKEEMMK